MKDYTTTTPFWRAGLLVHEGSTLRLSAAEAKYLGHALVEVTDEAPTAQPAPAATEEETEVASYGATTAEDARRKRK